MGLCLRAIALNGGARTARDSEHGGVFRQRVNEQHRHPFVARVHHRALKQLAATTPTTRALGHRDAKLGAAQALRIDRKSQMGHGDQLQLAVENTQQRVALEVELGHVAADLFVVGGITKPQVTVMRIQRDQVLDDLLAVRQADGAYRDRR